jgi:hypothetical protein
MLILAVKLSHPHLPFNMPETFLQRFIAASSSNLRRKVINLSDLVSALISRHCEVGKN